MVTLLVVLVVDLLVAQVPILPILKLVLLVVEEDHRVLVAEAVVLADLLVVLYRAELVVLVRQMVTQTLEAAVAAVADTTAAVAAVAVMTMEVAPAMLLVEVVDQDMFILQYLTDLLEDLLVVRIIQIEETLGRQDKIQRLSLKVLPHLIL